MQPFSLHNNKPQHRFLGAAVVFSVGERFVHRPYIAFQRFSALRSTGTTASARAPPMSAVNSCGQVNMAGSLVSIGGANTTITVYFISALLLCPHSFVFCFAGSLKIPKRKPYAKYCLFIHLYASVLKYINKYHLLSRSAAA